MAVLSALEEDADVIGVSFLSGEHLTLTPQIVAEMKRRGMEDVLLIVGGIIPAVDEDALLKMGVKKVFRGSLVGEVVRYLSDHFGRPGSPANPVGLNEESR